MRLLPVTFATLFAIAPAPAADPAAVEFLLTGGDRAAVLRCELEVGGRPLRAARADALAALFANLDADGSGSLDRREAGRVPSALRVRQLGWGYLWAVPAPPPWADLDTAPADGRVTRDELAGYYRRHDADGPQVGVGHAAPPGPLTDALLKALDRDADGRVSGGEWAGAEAALRPLDRDGDELVRAEELVPRSPYPGSGGGVGLPAAAGGAPNRLLDTLPLRRAAAGSEPAATLTLRTGAEASDAVWAGPPAKDAPGFAQTVGGVRVLGYAVTGRLAEEWAAARKLADARFAAADADRDGGLTRAEADDAAFAPLRDHFAAADRDGDGRLTAGEWAAYLDVRGKLVAARASVTVFDHGRGLFELLDADADGALSVRELRGAWGRAEAAGCVAGGELDREKLPRVVRLVASAGRPPRVVRTLVPVGPGWFRAMDRNRDGDVSRSEFVGPAAAFDKLDADRDGLLSPAEAEKAAPPK